MSRLLPFLLMAVFTLPAAAQPGPQPDRGELLYTTYCIACHTAQMHWRDNRRATDWKALRAWVQHWEKFSALGWSREDVVLVARYLNALYYHFPEKD